MDTRKYFNEDQEVLKQWYNHCFSSWFFDVREPNGSLTRYQLGGFSKDGMPQIYKKLS